MLKTVFINGKFLAQTMTGVQRYACELLKAFDALLDEDDWTALSSFVLLVPTHRIHELPTLRHIKIHEIPSSNLYLWEQVHLPWFSRGSILINLAGSAPLIKFGQISTFHDTAVFDKPKSFSVKFVYWYRLLFNVQGNLSRHVLTVSQFSKERLVHHLGIDPNKIDVVHCGADHMLHQQSDAAVLSKLGIYTDRYFLAVGSSNPNKNFSRLIEAFSSLKDPGARLVVVGGSNVAVFSEASDAVQEDQRIVRAGRLTDFEIKALYSHARAYVFPSIYEGFGLPPVEAMYCGCPVLAARAASIPEICGTGVSFFDPYSVDDIRATMQRALYDEVWLKELRQNGKDRAKTFTWRSASLRLACVLTRVGLLQSNQSLDEHVESLKT